MDKRQFGVFDFVSFFGLLVVSVAIGVYYALVDRKNKSVENYHFGGRKMSSIPVGLSMGVSFISAITVLGYPGHAYVYGTITFWFGIAALFQLFIAWFYYIPLLHRFHLSSVYEYLEERFNRSARMAASTMTILSMLMYMGTTLYLTALALDAVTSIGINVSVAVTAIVCTLYTTLGGMKAVVLTDSFQSAIMITGIFAVFIRTTMLVGGFGKVFEAIDRGERNTFFTVDFDITVRHTIWSILLGEGLVWIGVVCTNQTMTQRYLACKNVKTAKRASIISTVLIMTMILASTFNGCAMYAYFEGCDPVLAGRVEKVDQTVPYLVMEIFSNAPGMAGLFVSAAYSGMLSTLSSGINALSVLVLQDFVLTIKPNLSDSARLTISKLTGVFFGASVLGLSFFAKHAAKTVVQFSSAMAGTFKGPVLGLFVLGIHFPWTNTIGALCGTITGIIFSLWLSLGAIFLGPKTDPRKLPLSTSACYSNLTNHIFNGTTTAFDLQNWNTTAKTQSIITSTSENEPTSATVYSISYLYYASLGLVITVTVGLLVSFITGRSNPKNMDPKLFVPLVSGKYLPKKAQKFFRFGVPDYIPETLGCYNDVKIELLLNLKKDTAKTESHSDIKCSPKNANIQNKV